MRSPDGVLVTREVPLNEALQKMDKSSLQVLLVVGECGDLVGVITDGDVRRALLRGIDMKVPVCEVMNPSPKVLHLGATDGDASKIMQELRIRHVPVVDDENKVRGLITWEDLFEPIIEEHPESVVIMAGGRGTRLDPFTKILPKPMIPVNDRPVVEVIMDKFAKQGFRRFVLSLGYKAEIVKAYFSNGDPRSYEVEFVEESQPMGTAGSLSLLRGKISGDFIVSNCDVVMDINLSEVLQYHREKRHQMTIVGALRDFVVPYGVLRPENGTVRIDEKPKFSFLVNTGIYVINQEVIEMVPHGECNMTDLISLLCERRKKVGVFPSRADWFDIGQWDEYKRTLQQLGRIAE